MQESISGHLMNIIIDIMFASFDSINKIVFILFVQPVCASILIISCWE